MISSGKVKMEDIGYIKRFLSKKFLLNKDCPYQERSPEPGLMLDQQNIPFVQETLLTNSNSSESNIKTHP